MTPPLGVDPGASEVEPAVVPVPKSRQDAFIFRAPFLYQEDPNRRVLGGDRRPVLDFCDHDRPAARLGLFPRRMFHEIQS